MKISRLITLLFLLVAGAGYGQVMKLTSTDGKLVSIGIDDIVFVRAGSPSGSVITYTPQQIRINVTNSMSNVQANSCSNLVSLSLFENVSGVEKQVTLLINVRQILQVQPDVNSKAIITMRTTPRITYRTVGSYSSVAAAVSACISGGGGGGVTVVTDGTLDGDGSSGDPLTVKPVGTTLIVDAAVTNAKLATMPANTFKGNNTGSTGPVLDLTKVQMQTALSISPIISMTGLAEGNTNLLTFTGTTIPNNSTIKAALQALETAIESVPALTDGDKGDIDVTGSGTVWRVDTGAVNTIKLATSAVDSSKIAPLAVQTSDIAALAVTLAKLATNSVDSTKILPGAVGTGEIRNGSILFSDWAQNGASSGQIPKWNGSAWVPAADNNDVYTAGYGIDVTANVISNAGVTTINGETGDVIDYVKNPDPIGSVGGDLTGLFQEPYVIGIQGIPVDLTGLANGNTMVYDSGTNTWKPGAGGGGGISDGDKGDITVSGAGAVWTIDTATITSAKIVNGTITGIDLALGAVTMTKIAQAGATSGQVLKWNGTNWAPGTITGTSQNIHQTLLVGNNTRKNIVWDSIVAHPANETGYGYNILTINPMDTLNQGNVNGSSPLKLGISTNGGVTHSNQVMYFGWNLEPGGGATYAGRPGIGYAIEQRWRPGTGVDKSEMHFIWMRRDGFPVRLGSYEGDNSVLSGDAALYHTVNRFSLRYGSHLNPDYFSVQGNAASNLSNFVLTNSTGSFSFDYNTSGDANLTLSNTKTSGTPQLNFSGFNTIGAGTIGSISVPSGFQINAADGSLLQFSSGQHRWITGGYQPIRLRPNAKNALECWANAAGNYGLNIGNNLFGLENTTRLQVNSETTNSSSYAARFFASSSTNVILSIRGDSKVGIKNDTPARELDVTGEVRVSDLTTDAPTRFVGADADGDFGQITWGNQFTTSGTDLKLAQNSATTSQVMKWDGSAWAPGLDRTARVKIDTFTTSRTWAMPDSAKTVYVIVVGGGGGGRSGSKGGSGINIPGGSGGGSGGRSEKMFAATSLTSTISVVVGAGGAGGAGETVDDGDGNDGSDGGTSGFGRFLYAAPGKGATSIGGVLGQGLISDGAAGGVESFTTGANGTSGKYSSGSGAAGGGINASNTVTAGGAGTLSLLFAGTSGVTSGAAGTSSGGNGGAGSKDDTIFVSSGGGGGGSNISGAGGNGGAGALYGSGGGGGGAARNGANSGAGGKGGGGFVVVITYY